MNYKTVLESERDCLNHTEGALAWLERQHKRVSAWVRISGNSSQDQTPHLDIEDPAEAG